jgi:hypothetical protein
MWHIFKLLYCNSVPWLRQTSERFDWTLRRSRRPPAQRTCGIAEIAAAKIALDRRWNWRFRYRSSCLRNRRETSCLLWLSLTATLRSCGHRAFADPAILRIAHCLLRKALQLLWICIDLDSLTPEGMYVS